MKSIYRPILYSILLIFALSAICCKKDGQKVAETSTPLPPNNLLTELSSEDPGNLQWINKPESFKLENGSLKAVAEKGTDFFNNPADSTITSTAPLLYTQIKGDFVATALVKPDFSSLWNAVALMVHIDDNNWIKFAFENSDATGPSIVSVVTKEVSDDANGVILKDQDQLWLKLIRKGNAYSMLWSKDGNAFKMARLSTLPYVDSIKIGLEVQSPVGESATHEIKYFGVEQRTVEDLRKGE